MDLSYNGTMEAYYQKFIELQEKLRKSEEERLKLEMKFNEMLQVTREEEQAHYKKLRSQYKRFLEEDKKRQERNERIVRTLERIEARVNMLTSRTDRIKMLKCQYQTYLQRIARMKPVDKIEHPPSKIEEDTPREQQTHNIPEYTKDIPDHLSLQKAMGKSNEEKIEILDKYLQSLATQKCRDAVDNEDKDPQSDLNHLTYLDNISKKLNDDFDSNQANSIAEDIMNSIYSRHYKKDLFKDETKKANKFTTSNYLNNDIPLQQKSSALGDYYNTSSALANLDNNVAIAKELHKNVPILNFEDNISIIRNDSGGLNKSNYDIQKTLTVYNKQGDKKEIDSDTARKRMLESRANTLSKNKDLDQLFNNEQHKTKDFTRNDPEYIKRNESQVNPSFKSMIKTSNPDLLLKDEEYQPRDSTTNDYPKTHQIQRQVDPINKRTEYRNKADQVIKEEDHLSKDFTTNSEHLKPEQRVKFEELKDDKVYGPSKTEIDVIENEKQIVDNYPVPRGDSLSNDIGDKVIEQHNQLGAIQREVEHTKHEQNREHYNTTDNEISNRNNHFAEQLENKIKKTQNNEELAKTARTVNDTESALNNEYQEIETTTPYQQFNENESNYDNEVNDIDQLTANAQHTPKYENKIDIQNNDAIRDEYDQQVINEGQSQYVESKAPVQYNQYEEPIQYDQFGNQIMYDENGQIVESQYDANQSQPYDGVEQQNYDENILDVQYDESGQPVHPYDQQYDADGQPIHYDQQYDASGQPVEQLYDENGQVFQQYDQSGQLHPYNQNSHPMQYDENSDLLPQYDENGQLIQPYDDGGQPMNLYDQTDQPTEHVESSQPIQEYEENEQLTEQYNQDGQSVQEYEQPFQQYENEQSLEQYEQGDQLIQEYKQTFQQYDANGQPISQYDENGQLISEYDENGQPIYQYDKNVQPLQQYDENGQLIHHYNENSLHQYNENDQPPEGCDEKSQPIPQGENVQLSQDVSMLGTRDNELDEVPASTNKSQRGDRSETDSSKSTVKADVNSVMVEENSESQPVKQNNVLDMLDTDTESVKQSTSKISNDSDFDFSNG